MSRSCQAFKDSVYISQTALNTQQALQNLFFDSSCGTLLIHIIQQLHSNEHYPDMSSRGPLARAYLLSILTLVREVQGHTSSLITMTLLCAMASWINVDQRTRRYEASMMPGAQAS